MSQVMPRGVDCSFVVFSLAPGMLHDLSDGKSLVNVAVQHGFDEIDGVVAHDPGNAKFVIHDLIDAVKRIFFVDKRVEQNTKGPDILFFAAVGFPL